MQRPHTNIPPFHSSGSFRQAAQHAQRPRDEVLRPEENGRVRAKGHGGNSVRDGRNH